MKKRMKKISILGVSMTMFLSAGMTTLAANNEITDTRTFTISTKADDTHQYEIYQVLKGDLAGTAKDGNDSENKLSNIKAGQNAKGLDTETAETDYYADIVTGTNGEATVTLPRGLYLVVGEKVENIYTPVPLLIKINSEKKLTCYVKYTTTETGPVQKKIKDKPKTGDKRGVYVC